MQIFPRKGDFFRELSIRGIKIRLYCKKILIQLQLLHKFRVLD